MRYDVHDVTRRIMPTVIIWRWRWRWRWRRLRRRRWWWWCAPMWNTSCAWGRHNMPLPPASWPLTFWPWKWCPSHVWRGLPLCANFSLPRPLRSRVRPDVRDRQTDVRRQLRIIA